MSTCTFGGCRNPRERTVTLFWPCCGQTVTRELCGEQHRVGIAVKASCCSWCGSFEHLIALDVHDLDQVTEWLAIPDREYSPPF